MDLWFRDDVVRILASVHETMRCTSESASGDSQDVAAAYQQGFGDALRVVAISFGLVAPGLGTYGKGRGATQPRKQISSEGVSKGD